MMTLDAHWQQFHKEVLTGLGYTLPQIENVRSAFYEGAAAVILLAASDVPLDTLRHEIIGVLRTPLAPEVDPRPLEQHGP